MMDRCEPSKMFVILVIYEIWGIWDEDLPGGIMEINRHTYDVDWTKCWLPLIGQTSFVG